MPRLPSTPKRRSSSRRDAVEANLGRRPEQVSADAGYCSEENLAGLEVRTIDAYVATGQGRCCRHGQG
jgi:hypothetical protein